MASSLDHDEKERFRLWGISNFDNTNFRTVLVTPLLVAAVSEKTQKCSQTSLNGLHYHHINEKRCSERNMIANRYPKQFENDMTSVPFDLPSHLPQPALSLVLVVPLNKANYPCCLPTT